MPLYALNKLGINAEQFFGKVLVTGSHENAVLSLWQGTVQTAANWWNAPDDSNLTRMLDKGMIKTADGKPATVKDFRIILKSSLIINSFDRLSDGKNQPWQPVDNAAYDDTIKLITFVDHLRKQNG
jgi:phosphonate transport system substrate-binding protein